MAAALILSGSVFQDMSAQNHRTYHSSTEQSRPQKPTGKNKRPEGNKNHNRPGNGKPGNRPGNNGNHNRPGNGKPGNRPGNHNRPGNRPGNRP